MAFTKYLVPALAVASTAAAAVCSISSSSTTTISNPAGASALASCKTFTGDVAIQTGTDLSGLVDLGTIQEIDGNFVYDSDNSVATISLKALHKISGDLTFSNLTKLSTLDLSSLNEVGGDATWSGLGSLGSLGLSQTGLASVNNTLITDTKISALTGLTNTAKIGGVDISNNNLLSDISMSFVSISGDINIGVNDVANGGVTVKFPNLLYAMADLNIRNSTSVSLPSLSTVAGNLGFYGNFFTSLTVPNITSTKGLFIDDNFKLTNISFPLLNSINGSHPGDSGCQIANNTNLKAISGFPVLATVDGGLDFSGNFTTVTLNSLKHVSGAMNVQTSGSLDCTNINNLQSSQVVLGSITCDAGVADPGTAGSTPTSTGSGSSTSSSGAAHPLNVPVAVGGFSVLGALFQVLFL